MLLCDVPLGGAFFDLGWRVTVYHSPMGLFDWRRTAVPAGMKLDTKRVTVDEPLKFFQRHKITQHNTTTMLRSGTEWAKKYDRSSLRVLGTMEESINSETYDVVREAVLHRRHARADGDR